MLKRHDRTKYLECLLTWAPSAPGVCSFLGTMSIMECGRGTLALILDGQVEIREPRVASALAEHTSISAPGRRMTAGSDHRFMSNVSPMPHAARSRSARMG
jgi:hypothetical protein